MKTLAVWKDLPRPMVYMDIDLQGQRFTMPMIYNIFF